MADADRASPGGLDQRKVIYYSAGWQVLQEDIDNHTNNSLLNGVDKRTQQIWGVRYIDDAVAKRVDATANGSYAGTDDRLYFYCTDAQFSSTSGSSGVSPLTP